MKSFIMMLIASALVIGCESKLAVTVDSHAKGEVDASVEVAADVSSDVSSEVAEVSTDADTGK